LRRLGQEVIPFDLSFYQPGSKLIAAARYRIPPFDLLVWRVNRDLLRMVRQHQPDIVWFDKPIDFTPSTIQAIKRTGAQTVSYNQDNPFGLLHERCWYQYHRAFRLFDLHCIFRETDVARYSQWGLPWIRTVLSFEPSVHYPPPADWSDSQRTRSVSYVGSPYEKRPEFLVHLGEEQRVPIVISGPRWKKFLSPELFRRYVTHGYLSDAEYREAIWQSRINLSFVTHFNEEDIGHKSVEIAGCQGFLLALRTQGHLALFEEDDEAVFFSSLEECADKCRFYLGRPDLREAIARRGRERAVRSGYDNDTQLARILNHLDGSVQSAASEG
jgi:spore maturation protein CgeB